MASVTSIVTFADAEIRYVSVVESACPSPFGLIASGSVASASMASGAVPPPALNVPTAGRAEPAEIVQPYAPRGNPAESHVQSTAVPEPVPRAISVPVEPAIATAQLWDWDETRPDAKGGARNRRSWVEDLRAPEGSRSRRDRAEPSVEDVARAGGESGIAVPGDAVQQDGDAARVAVAATGDEGEERRRVDVREVEPPGDESRDRFLRSRRTGRTFSYVPRSAIPTEPVLKPIACAPITLRSMPPKRPS